MENSMYLCNERKQISTNFLIDDILNIIIEYNFFVVRILFLEENIVLG